MSVQIIDLFCGIGGLTRGLINSGLDVFAGFDIDSACKYTYERNNKVKYCVQNIRNLKGDVLNKLYSTDSFKILVGCAPCQPFSKMRFKFGKANFHDEKYNLLLEYGRLIQESHPAVIAMENVPQIQNTSVFAKFLKILVSEGYKINYKVLYCPDYGIPQTRRRFVLVGSTLGTIDIIPPTHNRASIHVRDMICLALKLGKLILLILYTVRPAFLQKI